MRGDSGVASGVAKLGHTGARYSTGVRFKALI